MLATHDWLTSRRLISININYQLIIYLKLYLNCNTINMIISLIVKIIRYCLSLRQLEVDFWQGHHQYPCCSQRCTFKASRTFYTKYRIYLLSSLLFPALFRRDIGGSVEAASAASAVCSVCTWCRPLNVTAGLCSLITFLHQTTFRLSAVSCELWGGDVAASTVQDRLSPGRTSTSNQTQQQHSFITRPDTTILDLTLIPSFLCLPPSTHLQLSRPCKQPRVMWSI